MTFNPHTEKSKKAVLLSQRSCAWFGCQKSKCADWLSNVPCMSFCFFTCFRIQKNECAGKYIWKGQVPIIRVNTPF